MLVFLKPGRGISKNYKIACMSCIDGKNIKDKDISMMVPLGSPEARAVLPKPIQEKYTCEFCTMEMRVVNPPKK
jgi:hypothetical protein